MPNVLSILSLYKRRNFPRQVITYSFLVIIKSLVRCVQVVVQNISFKRILTLYYSHDSYSEYLMYLGKVPSITENSDGTVVQVTWD